MLPATAHPAGGLLRSIAWRWTLLAMLPLVLLAVDVAMFPRFFERWKLLESVEAVALMEQRIVHVGTFNATALHAAVESLNDEPCLEYLVERSPSGLVISLFVEDGMSYEGELARTVRRRVRAISPTAHRRIAEFFEEMGKRNPGEVAGIDLQIPRPDRMRFPVDRLIVVVFERGQSRHGVDFLDEAMRRVFADAHSASLAAVTVPCIGYQWADKNSLTFDDIFRPLFAAMAGSSRPMEVFISLYSGWPTFAFEEAVGSLNHAWAGGAPGMWERIPSIHRGRYRAFLILLSVCLLACSRHVQRNLKSFLLVTGAYAALASGLAELVELFMPDYPSQAVTAAVFLAWAVLAIGFPLFLRWDVQNIFRGKAG